MKEKNSLSFFTLQLIRIIERKKKLTFFRIAGLQRCGKSCRLRWINYLRPDLKRGMFSKQEEDLIIIFMKHLEIGNIYYIH